MRFSRLGIHLLLAVALFSSADAQQQEEQEPPIDVGLTEEVQVQLVLVDFLVLDGKDRTVPGLTIDDFRLTVEGKEVEIATLDRDCPAGRADDPRPGSAEPNLPAVATAQPRRIVLVFDYFHITNVAETMDLAMEMVDKWPQGGEEHMVVSLGQILRIESPLSSDLGDLRWTLQRMKNDPDLYGGNHFMLTNFSYFDRIQALFDLMERWPGRKSIVLFSGPFRPDAFFHDPEYKELSAMSVAARTSLYPVDTGGLRTPSDPNGSPLGGPSDLRRLANETGGRMTADMNEIGLAYARAHRDLGCTYTLGFYDNRPRPDRQRRLAIRVVDRKGIRVIYPGFYVVRSPEQRRESLFRTASMAPHMFESEEMGTDLFVLGPDSLDRWSTLMAMEVRLGSEEVVEKGEKWELKGFLRKPNGTPVHRFERLISMPATDPVTGVTPKVTFFKKIAVDPGRYVVSVVLSDPGGQAPRAATRSVELAKIPVGSPFLLGPILGHGSATTGKSKRLPSKSFEPMVLAHAEQGELLESLTLVCIAGSKSPIDIPDVAREIVTPEGDGVRRFDPAPVTLPGRYRVHCHELLDRVSTAALAPGRYEITAEAEVPDRLMGGGSAEFSIRPAAE